jgi:hypothetical protein
MIETEHKPVGGYRESHEFAWPNFSQDRYISVVSLTGTADSMRGFH